MLIFQPFAFAISGDLGSSVDPNTRLDHFAMNKTTSTPPFITTGRIGRLLLGCALFSAASCAVYPPPYQNDPAFATPPPGNRYGYRGTESPNNRTGRVATNPDESSAETPRRIVKIKRDPGDTTVDIRPPETKETNEKPEEKLVEKPDVKPAPAEKKDPPAKPSVKDDLPYGIPVVGKPGNVYSPYANDKGYVDVDGLPRGTRVKCPYTSKHFRVP